jgi:ribosome maturation factor RimP
MLKEKTERALTEALDENPSLFLIGLKVDEHNQIRVVIDGDKGVSVGDCVMLSRKIEQSLDRDNEDFSIEVTSAGADQPLEIPRQFKKNIGRKMDVRTKDEKIEGELVAANDETITLTWKAREPKPVGKGKHTVQKETVLKYEEIEEAKTKLKF